MHWSLWINIFESHTLTLQLLITSSSSYTILAGISLEIILSNKVFSSLIENTNFLNYNKLLLIFLLSTLSN